MAVLEGTFNDGDTIVVTPGANGTLEFHKMGDREAAHV
jgi:hypothetical protein